MKVLHLVAGELSEGAAKGAFWLHKAQLELGIESQLLTSGKDKDGSEGVISLSKNPIQIVKVAVLSRLGNWPILFYRRRLTGIFNTGFSGINITRLDAYRDADIIHLHWINGLVSLKTIRNIKKPMVWTIRDMWPLTGGCHVTLSCRKYETGCGKCPQLKSRSKLDLSRFVVWAKQRSYPPQLHVVGISKWITSCIKRAVVFQGFPVRTISNNIDSNTFSPIPSHEARRILKIPADKKIILIGAQRVTDYYKGFGFFLEALSKLKDTNSFHVVTFGRGASNAMVSSLVPQTHLGFLSDSISLQLAYSSADVFVAPSLMDAFGKTLAESLSCGTPVVCFDATGPADIVEHMKTGYKAKPFESIDLARGIEWVFSLPKDKYEDIRLQSRHRAIELFDSRVIAKEYLELYNEILRNSRS